MVYFYPQFSSNKSLCLCREIYMTCDTWYITGYSALVRKGGAWPHIHALYITTLSLVALHIITPSLKLITTPTRHHPLESTHAIHPEDHYTTMDPPQQPTGEGSNLDGMLQWESPSAALFPSDLSRFISPDNQNEFPVSDISLTTDNGFEAGLFNTDLPTLTDSLGNPEESWCNFYPRVMLLSNDLTVAAPPDLGLSGLICLTSRPLAIRG